MSYAILIGIGVAGLVFYIHRKRRHSFFHKLGIPGPKPHWLFGNLHQIWGRQLHVVYSDWSKEFGEFYGYFEGPTPILVTSSIDGVEQICVKQYSNFQGHRFGFPVRPDPTILSRKQQSGITTPNLFFEWGKVWKKQRLLCNPAFSTGKIKQYKQFVTATQNKLMDKFTEKCEAGEDLEIQQYYQSFTIEIIADVAFGIQVEAPDQKESPILKSVRDILHFNQDNDSFVIRLLFVFPDLAKLFKNFSQILERFTGILLGPLAIIQQLYEQMYEIVKVRKEHPELKRPDILQNLLDASLVTEENVPNSANDREASRLNMDEVVCNGMVLFFAGTETTSTFLSWASYLLATHPDIQQKLYEEIKVLFKDKEVNSEIDYDQLMNLRYLDNVCNEVLRLYPIAFGAVNRFVVDETDLCGIHIPRGIEGVVIDTLSLHYNDKYWGPVDTSIFFPDRFDDDYPTKSERPNAAFLAFGYGPRICLGMRLAYLEMKMVLANVLRRFKIQPPADGYPANGIETKATVAIEPVNLKIALVKRQL